MKIEEVALIKRHARQRIVNLKHLVSRESERRFHLPVGWFETIFNSCNLINN